MISKFACEKKRCGGPYIFVVFFIAFTFLFFIGVVAQRKKTPNDGDGNGATGNEETAANCPQNKFIMMLN